MESVIIIIIIKSCELAVCLTGWLASLASKSRGQTSDWRRQHTIGTKRTKQLIHFHLARPRLPVKIQAALLPAPVASYWFARPLV